MTATAIKARNLGETKRPSWPEFLEEPAGYVNGANLYEFVQSNPMSSLDPSGLAVEIKEIQDDNMARATGAAAGTAVLDGSIYVQLINTASGATTQPTSQPTTAPTTQCNCVQVKDVFDTLRIETLYASVNYILQRGRVNPVNATPAQIQRAENFQKAALDFERTHWQYGLKSTWETEVAVFKANVLAIPKGTEADVVAAVQKEYSALGDRVTTGWQALEAADAGLRNGAGGGGGPALRPGWGASQWGKVKLSTGYDTPK